MWLLGSLGCVPGVCETTLPLPVDGQVEICGGGWVHLGWEPEDPTEDAPRLDLFTLDDAVSTADLPPGGTWANTPALLAWAPDPAPTVRAQGGGPGSLTVRPADAIERLAGLVAVPTRGPTAVVVTRAVDVGPIEVWAREEVVLRDPEGRVVGEGRELVVWEPGVGAWTVEVGGPWDVVWSRTWGADFGAPRDEVEPNDSSSTAEPLGVAGVEPVEWDGILDGTDDWFHLDATAPFDGTLSCRDREAGGTVRPTYQVWSADGRLLRDLSPLTWEVGQVLPWNQTSFPVDVGGVRVHVSTELPGPGAYYRCVLESTLPEAR